jgi:hypothetical protein
VVTDLWFFLIQNVINFKALIPPAVLEYSYFIYAISSKVNESGFMARLARGLSAVAAGAASYSAVGK